MVLKSSKYCKFEFLFSFCLNKKVFLIKLVNFMYYYYIHKLSLQRFSQHYDLLTPLMYAVCLNFIREWRTLQFKVDYERQIFEKLFMVILIYCRREKSTDRKWPIVSNFVLLEMCDLGFKSGFTFNNSKHYLLNYGESANRKNCSDR